MEKEMLARYTGHLSQLYELRRVRLEEGRAAGTTVIEAVTAGGLQADILPDTGFDLGLVRFKGNNTAFISKNGYDSPAAFIPYEMEFLQTFPGGLLYTCGLRNVGPPCREGTEYQPQHGRVHGLQAEQVCAAVIDDDLVITGTLRETALFGHVLELRRRITIPIFDSRIIIEDTLENLTSKSEEYMLLYHCNFGYPLISEKARLVLPEQRKTTPRNEFSKTGFGRECTFNPPLDGEEERVFFHEMSEHWAKIENPSVNMAVTLAWSGDSLPVLAQWRSMAGGDYVLGLEPSNNFIMGRVKERENGTLKIIGAFESVHTKLEFGFETIGETGR